MPKEPTTRKAEGEMRPETVDVMSLFGAIKPRVKGVSVKDMDEAVRRSAAGK